MLIRLPMLVNPLFIEKSQLSISGKGLQAAGHRSCAGTWSVQAHVGNNIIEATAHANLHGLIRLEIKRVETIFRLEEDDVSAVRKGNHHTR